MWQFINGELWLGKEATSNVDLTPLYLVISPSFLTQFHCHGRLSDFRIYDYNMSAEEIQEMYFLGANPEIPGTIQIKSTGSTSLSFEVEGDPNVD